MSYSFVFNPLSGKFDMVQSLGYLNTVFLKLDTTNDPLTGNLEISKADPESRLTDTGNSEYTRVTKSDTDNLATRMNRIVRPSGGGTPYAVEIKTGVGSMSGAGTFPTDYPISFSFWVKPISFISAAFFQFQSGSIKCNMAWWNADYVYVNNDTGKPWHRFETDFASVGVATHWVITFSQSGAAETYATVYKNGTLQSDNRDDTFSLPLGSDGFVLSYSIDCIWDEVAIYNKVLSQSEVTALYGLGLGYYHDGTEDGIVSYWHIDENTGTTLNDGKSTNNLSLTGTYTWGSGLISISSGSVDVPYEITVWSSKNVGDLVNKGVQTFGDSAGKTVLEGASTRFNISGTEVGQISANGYLGLWTTSPHSYMDIRGSTASTITTVTSGTTLGVVNSFVLANPSSSTITLTLPTASGIAGRYYTIKRINSGTNTVDVTTSGTETIDGSSVQTIDVQYASMNLVSDGTNWYIT